MFSDVCFRNPERSYKKSKKHKKKAKKRRHKSVSITRGPRNDHMTATTRVTVGCDTDQASPDSDSEKKGRERDGKREKDADKEKEVDKSRGKTRSESKLKSPKRKTAKEEVVERSSERVRRAPVDVSNPLLRVAFRAAGTRRAAS